MFSAKNKFFKYKLLALLLVLAILTDAVTHKGMVRVMKPKTFLNTPPSSQNVYPGIMLINKNKNWIKAVNTPKRMKAVGINTSGIEMDIYFDSATKTFLVHHAVAAPVSYPFDDLLKIYQKKGLSASIWMDFKNLSLKNQQDALITLIRLREKYQLENKILVESGFPELLNSFVDQHFYTSYYTPYFNPYFLDRDSLQKIDLEIQNNLLKSKVQALSGFYFQLPFLHERFPNYPILIWTGDDKISLVNLIFRNFINNRKEVFIKLARQKLLFYHFEVTTSFGAFKMKYINSFRKKTEI